MTIGDAIFCVIDTETTGLDPAADQLVEVAMRFCWLGKDDPLITAYETLCKPTIPVPVTASAIHHLIDADLESAPSREEVRGWIEHHLAPYPDAILVAHNAPFDRGFLPELAERTWLCTKRLAMHLWPDAPAFNNQVLRYQLGHARIDLRGNLPHRASADTIVTAAILADAAEVYADRFGDDLDGLLNLAQRPVLLKAIPFGKHRGALFQSVPRDYLQWCLREMRDMDADLRYTIEHTLRVAA